MVVLSKLITDSVLVDVNVVDKSKIKTCTITSLFQLALLFPTCFDLVALLRVTSLHL